jgi:hypothetical protein
MSTREAVAVANFGMSEVIVMVTIVNGVQEIHC